MVKIEINILQLIVLFIPAFIGTFIGNLLSIYYLPKGNDLKSNLFKSFWGTIIGFFIGAIISIIFFLIWKKAKTTKLLSNSKILEELNPQANAIVIKN